VPDCEFNEREFETAVNHELIATWQPYLIGGLPMQPSQFAEKARGYDAAYSFKFGRRIFLQYKVAYAAAKRTGTNRDLFDAWGGPYMRAELLLDKARVPHQHNRLVRLAASGEDVYYCAPLFHELRALSLHARSSSVWLSSLHAPLKGAPALGHGPHSLSYRASGLHWRLHSEIGEPRDASGAAEVFSRAVHRPFSPEVFAELTTRVSGLLEAPVSDIATPQFAVDLGPLAELDWLLSRHLGAVLVLFPDRATQRRE
jgi:hypothetical protein